MHGIGGRRCAAMSDSAGLDVIEIYFVLWMIYRLGVVV